MRILVYDVDFASSGNIYPIKTALEELRHTADMFDWRKYLFSYNDSTLLNRVKDRFFFDSVAKRINQDVKKMLEKGSYDLFLVVRGDHLYPETIDYAKQKVAKVVNWNTDDLFNKLNNTRHILNGFQKYHIHFSPRKHLREEYLAKGANTFEVVDWYYRPEMAAPSFPDRIRYDAEIRFIGSWSERRISLLKSISHLPCEMIGWGWSKKTATKNFPFWKIKSPIGMQEMSNFFSTTKINVNIMTIENRDLINPRAFDIPAAGGFQLAERSDEILEVFKEGVEIACFSTSEELKDKCEFYLRNDMIRQKMALAGYQKVISGKHKLVDSVEQLIKKVSGNG